MKKVKTHLTKNQYQKEFFDLHGYDSPFNSKEEEEAEIKQIEHDKEQFISMYGVEGFNEHCKIVAKAIEMRLNVIKRIESN